MVADTIFERDSMSHQASTIGSLEAVGLGWHYRDEYVGKIKAITREQVVAAARKFLVPRTLTVAHLMPEVVR